VLDEAGERCELRELSLGDYVLNGGEAAALAMIEAVVRLLPGFLGNAASLQEESHVDGLLEYPVYTRPASWRGREVPEVLLSGDHDRIAAWRREQAERRTAARRPDLLPPAALLDDVTVRAAEPGDAGELLTLQRACWAPERPANPQLELDALTETLDDVRRRLGERLVLVARSGSRLVGAVAADRRGTDWHVGRLMVAPDLQGRGLGRALLRRIEEAAPDGVTQFRLSTGTGSTRSLRILRKAGYRVAGTDRPGVVRLVKPRR
jgi:tRNA (guanine37-N1)-methyltransferase